MYVLSLGEVSIYGTLPETGVSFSCGRVMGSSYVDTYSLFPLSLHTVVQQFDPSCGHVCLLPVSGVWMSVTILFV